MNKLKLGIDVGGTKVAYGLLSEDNKIVYQYQTANDLEITPDEFTEKLCKEIHDTLEQSGHDLANLSGIAVAMPSYVDYDNGIVITSGSLYKLKNYSIGEQLKARFPNASIIIDNDTNVAALAEHKYGSGKGFHHMVYVALSTGIGTGFIINDALFRGNYGGAGESGHMIITANQGLTDGCGNQGCFMSYASGSQIARHAVKAIEEGTQTLLTGMKDNLLDITSVDIAAAYKKGDALSTKLIEQSAYYAAMHIYNLFIAFNINCYVCGGGLTNMGDFYLEKIRTHVDSFNKQENQKIYIKEATLKGTSGIIGCGVALDDARKE